MKDAGRRDGEPLAVRSICWTSPPRGNRRRVGKASPESVSDICAEATAGLPTTGHRMGVRGRGPGWPNARHSGGGAYATDQAELSRLSFSRVVEACERYGPQNCGMRLHVRGRLWRVEHVLVVFCGLMHDAVGSWFRIPLVSQAALRNTLASRVSTIGEKQDAG